MKNKNIKTMKTFATTIKSAMEEYFGTGYSVQIHAVTKNNDRHLTGITIVDSKTNMSPTIYLDGLLEKHKSGESLTNICDEVVRIYEEHKVEGNFDVTSVTDFNKVAKFICYKMIGTAHNQEFLKDIPYVKFHDMALVFYILVSNSEDGLGTITVKNHFLKFWDVSKETLFELAIQNTQRLFRGRVESMASVMTEIILSKLDEESANEFYDMMADAEDIVPMYICSNTSKINGAGTILYDGLLREFANRVDNNFYILPSSIHETLLITDTGDMDVENLRDMVRTVNATEVAPDEILSDNVYYYNRLTDRVEML